MRVSASPEQTLCDSEHPSKGQPLAPTNKELGRASVLRTLRQQRVVVTVHSSVRLVEAKGVSVRSAKRNSPPRRLFEETEESWAHRTVRLEGERAESVPSNNRPVTVLDHLTPLSRVSRGRPTLRSCRHCRDAMSRKRVHDRDVTENTRNTLAKPTHVEVREERPLPRTRRQEPKQPVECDDKARLT